MIVNQIYKSIIKYNCSPNNYILTIKSIEMCCNFVAFSN